MVPVFIYSIIIILYIGSVYIYICFSFFQPMGLIFFSSTFSKTCVARAMYMVRRGSSVIVSRHCVLEENNIHCIQPEKKRFPLLLNACAETIVYVKCIDNENYNIMFSKI